MSTDARVLPRHVAIIMDGNGRWARNRCRPRQLGHKAGVDALERVVTECADRGIEVLTVFAFSSENWRRPRLEVDFLFELFLSALEHQVRRMHRRGVRLMVIGDRSAFPPGLQAAIVDAEALTARNTKLRLVVAANYGGRWDIVQAVRRLAGQAASGELAAADIDESAVASALSLAGLPEPDLFIRTGGEQRISNFLLWDLAYTELFFTDTLWPDFDTIEFERALAAFAQRQRRFGRTGDQLSAAGE